ncbi:hypothetical protein [Algibacter luteus]|uniref:Import component protein n=1 Tax=Algibacter luteus TaxID=1178825 RepID=A0A1M6EB03_9FLAO|nr:hypothetical protein [Algibacter luteus]WJJ95136.1 hypothetical protein O5O44_07860 [Algibacter luteus]SHI82697.1 hypothetical protein SAMN05216261_1889 [Algibacter luteus]
MTEEDISRGRKNAIISYITIIGFIVAYYLNNEEDKKSAFASFHIRQSLGLWLSFIVVNLSITRNFDIFMLRASVYVFFFTLIIYGLSNAIGRKSQPVPLLGNLFQKIFANLGS